MLPELMYQKFLLKINKGNTGGNIYCDETRFTLIINECKNRWVEQGLKSKDSILIDSLQEIVTTSSFSSPAVIKTDYNEYSLKDNFYEGILVKCKAKKKNCESVLFSREIKNQNKNIYQYDDLNKPNFEWEWTFHSFQGNKLRVYKSDFDIVSVDFEYYKVLPDIQIAGTVDINGNVITQSIGLDISEQYVDQIINLAATEFERNTQNQLGVALSKDREQSQE